MKNVYTKYKFVNIRGVTWNVINLITFYRMMFLIKFKKGMYNLVNIVQFFDQSEHDQWVCDDYYEHFQRKWLLSFLFPVSSLRQRGFISSVAFLCCLIFFEVLTGCIIHKTFKLLRVPHGVWWWDQHNPLLRVGYLCYKMLLESFDLLFKYSDFHG